MNGLGQYCVELLDRLVKLESAPLNILETGTMFKTDLEPGETDLSARSTFAIAEWSQMSPLPHDFLSIDASEEHIGACWKTLSAHGLDYCVTFCCGAGASTIKNLPRFATFDFVLLDSDSDADVILGEYLAVRERVVHNGIVVIDDAFKHPRWNKAAKVLPIVRGFAPIGGIAVAIPFGPDAGRICREVSSL